jgi:hypothetical protein
VVDAKDARQGASGCARARAEGLTAGEDRPAQGARRCINPRGVRRLLRRE